MKILVLDEWLPSMRNSGKSIRTFELLAPLARRHEITYLAHLGEAGQAENLRVMNESGFKPVCVPRRSVYGSVPAVLLGAFPALLDRLPISVRRHFSDDYTRKLLELTQSESFDLVHVEWSHYAAYAPYVPEIPSFVCTHNVEFLSWQRFTAATQNPLKKLLGLHEAKKLYRFEKEYYGKVDYLSVVSEDDARLVRGEFGIDDVCVIPNGVSIAPYDEIPNEPAADRLVYCGSMDAFINQDAVRWFVRNIFPRILERKPGATFTVIGRDPPASLLRLESDAVRFTGRVDDIRVPLKEGMLEVVPLRIAGGSRLKILEAFAAKIPVLSTTVGAEGLDVEDGRDIVLADTPEDFADRCIEILDDAALRQKLIAGGRELVDRQYDWSRLSPLVEEAWRRSIEKRRG